MEQFARDRSDVDLVATYLAKRANLVLFVAARVGSRTEAEDIVQDLFLRVQRVDRDTTVDNPTALLFRMAANLSVDHLRRVRRVAAHAVEDVTGTRAAEAPSDAPSPEEQWAARQRLGRLLESLERLPPRMRQAFELHKLQQLTLAETALRMGVTPKAVERQITAALKALTWP